MYLAMVIASAVFSLVGAADYISCIWKQKEGLKPVLATWILMVVTVWLSLWMYWHGPNHSVARNIGLFAAALNTTAILVALALFHHRNKTLVVAFNGVQAACLAGGGVVVIFWAVVQNSLIAFALVQGIALFSYTATVVPLWRAVGSTEPYFLWLAVLASNLCAVYPATQESDPFAYIYLIRAIPSIIFMLVLIARAKERKHQEEVRKVLADFASRQLWF